MKQFLLIAALVLIAASVFVLKFEPPPQETVISSAPALKTEKKQEDKKIVENLKEQINSLSKTVKDLKTIPPPPAPSPTATPPPAVKSADIYNKALGAVLNVFCLDRKANTYIFGSASIIQSKGYILTNGHLAMHFKDPNTECLLRKGSPARNFARAKVVWLPDQTPKIGVSEIPKNDGAILKITELSDGSPLPENFEYFDVNKNYVPKIGEKLYSLNYPSEFLGAEIALTNMNLVFTIGAVDSFLTVDDNAADAEGVYLKGELSAQHGSSGGIFLDVQKGDIVGLFVGLTEGKTTTDRMQFMFMSSYINRILIEEKGMGIAEYLATNP
ncbi:hypothetical protein A2739_01420 [Candidatus Giovannonibacteria bacterium RIFCSPHIGHO2_01_FULL_43_100]|nr:MAG: hypothetical protein A2739_01420 [Candidatus Giovannonibacteria bacterium RIFCSPHIGHO2_01_FULL_43_100]